MIEKVRNIKMIFVIDKLKYDTDKMRLISEKCKYNYSWTVGFTNMKMQSSGKDVKLWLSSKGNWLLTYRTDYFTRAIKFSVEQAEEILIKYDLEKYELLFGELEEA
jgi:hypothetical protein